MKFERHICVDFAGSADFSMVFLEEVRLNIRYNGWTVVSVKITENSDTGFEMLLTGTTPWTTKEDLRVK